jgi:hypothetical protein
MTSKILFSIIVIACFGCKTKSDQNIRSQVNISDLTNDSVKYWSDIWKLPYFNQYQEGGLAFYENGQLIEYQHTNENKRVILKESEDVICMPSTFRLRSDTLYIERCGWTFVFSIKKLNKDSLCIEEISEYGYFPDFGFSRDSIKIIFTISGDQKTRPIEDYRDFTQGPVRSIQTD